MKKFLIKVLGVQPEEVGQVSLLLAISFFIGVFLVTFDVTSSTLFMDKTGHGKEYLPHAYVFWGILGASASFVFVNLQKRTSFAFLVKSTLIFLFIYVAVLSAVLENTKTSPEVFKNVIFFSFASMGPLNALAILCFYGIVTRAFNLKNQKRLTGTVDQGQMFATAIAFFLIPVLDELLPYFSKDVIHYMYVSFTAITGSLILFFVFEKKYPNPGLMKPQVADKNELEAKAETFTRNKYVRLISLIFLISGIAAIFVDITFLSLTFDQFKEKPEQFAQFLGYFGGALTFFSLLLQIFIGDRVIETYGVKVALMILPLLLTIFTIISSFVGAIHLAPIILIVFVGLGKFFFQACRESFEEPIFKGFFLPIDKNIRHDVQAKIEGGFGQVSVLIAGGLLLSLSSNFFFNFELIYYTYFLVFVFIAYGYIVIKLHDQYQKTLKDTLASQKGKDGSGKRNSFSITETLSTELSSEHEERVIYSLKLMEKMEPVKFESILIGFASDPNPEIRKYAIQRIHELKLLNAIQSVRKLSEAEKSPVIKQLAQDALKYIDQTENIPLSGPKLIQLVKSKNPEDREFAAKILSRANNDEAILSLLLLMRDSNPHVRLIALVSAGRCKNQELWPLLIDSLSSSIFGNAAAGSLASVGEDVMPYLEAAFHKSGQTLQTQLRIVQIYGKIGGQKAMDLLWNKIDFPAKKIRTQVLLSLSSCGFKVDNETLVTIKQTLETAIGNAAWNVAALSEIETGESFKPIREALEEEIKNDNDLIFLLLSFIYDAQSIRLVKENLESGTIEGKLYGIELLDVFLEDDIQPLLFPLLDDITQEERTEKLQNYFPREALSSTDVLIHIINRDYNYINRWTKACAVFSLSVQPGYKVTDDLIANLFNPDPLLRETAAWVIHFLDPKVYHECSARLSHSVKKELDELLLPGVKQGELRIERIIKLKESPVFKNVPGVIVADLEELVSVVKFDANEMILEGGENGTSPLYVLISGEATVMEGSNSISTIKENGIIGEMLVLDSDKNNYKVKAMAPVTAYRIDKSRFFELMSNNYELAKEFVQVVGSRWITEKEDSKNLMYEK